MRKNLFKFELLSSLAVTLLGSVMLYYYYSRKLNFFIHPDYFFLVFYCGYFLIFVGVVKTIFSFKSSINCHDQEHNHNRSLVVLVLVCLFMIWNQPKVLSSNQVFSRAGDLSSDNLFSRDADYLSGFTLSPEKRTILDWVRLFYQDPNPEHYAGSKVRVKGFVLEDEALPEGYFYIARYVISCCVADARPIGILVKFDLGNQKLEKDRWYEISGEFFSDEVNSEKSAVIKLIEFNEIDTPDNPYEV